MQGKKISSATSTIVHYRSTGRICRNSKANRARHAGFQSCSLVKGGEKEAVMIRAMGLQRKPVGKRENEPEYKWENIPLKPLYAISTQTNLIRLFKLTADSQAPTCV